MVAYQDRRIKRVLMVQPDEKDDAGRFGLWLEAEGLQIDLVRPFAGEPVPTTSTADAVVVLGGSMGANDDAIHPWLLDIRGLLSDALSREVPTLGICLGAQLLAVASGGTVVQGDAGLECGVVSVEWTDGSVLDPLVGGMPEPFLAASMHFDAIDSLPVDAMLLGTGQTYPNQVFRIRRAWGVQFHPEVTPERFASWRSEVGPAFREGYDAHARIVESMDHEVRAGTRELARRFGAIVRGG